MWVASRVDYHIYHKLAWPLLALSMVLLTAVLFMPEYNGCKRWLVLPGLGTLQPSEIAKFAVVLVFAHIIALLSLIHISVPKRTRISTIIPPRMTRRSSVRSAQHSS